MHQKPVKNTCDTYYHHWGNTHLKRCRPRSPQLLKMRCNSRILSEDVSIQEEEALTGTGEQREVH